MASAPRPATRWSMNAGYRGSQRERTSAAGSRRSGAGAESSRHAQSPGSASRQLKSPRTTKAMPSARRMAAQFPRWRIRARRVLQVRLRFAARSWRAPQQPEIRCTQSSLSCRPSMGHRDVGPPAPGSLPHAQRLQVRVAPVADSPADREPGRQMAEARRRPAPAPAGSFRLRAQRHLHAPMRARKHPVRRRRVLDFLERDDVGVQFRQPAGDRRIVGAGPADAALAVAVLEMLQVPGGDPQFSRHPRRRRHKRDEEGQDCEGGFSHVRIP